MVAIRAMLLLTACLAFSSTTTQAATPPSPSPSPKPTSLPPSPSPRFNPPPSANTSVVDVHINPVAFGAFDVPEFKRDIVTRLLLAKKASKMTFSQIAAKLGLTNVYTAQLFYRQQTLSKAAAMKLQPMLAISSDDMAEMMTSPARRYSPEILQDPVVFRLFEAFMHAGDGIKAIVNEEFGDGIMSAIGFYMNLERGVGAEGEARVKIIFNGKYLQIAEQTVAGNVAVTVPFV